MPKESSLNSHSGPVFVQSRVVSSLVFKTRRREGPARDSSATKERQRRIPFRVNVAVESGPRHGSQNSVSVDSAGMWHGSVMTFRFAGQRRALGTEFNSPKRSKPLRVDEFPRVD